jgi:hypothetical protein
MDVFMRSTASLLKWCWQPAASTAACKVEAAGALSTTTAVHPPEERSVVVYLTSNISHQ